MAWRSIGNPRGGQAAVTRRTGRNQAESKREMTNGVFNEADDGNK